MSLIPLLASIVREVDDYRVGVNDLDDGFGFGIYPCDLYRPTVASLQISPRRRFSPYERSLHMMRAKRDHKDNVTLGKDGFQVCVDVSQFKPNELTVKTVGEQVVIEGKHGEREDEHGCISRQFVRKYQLPKGFDPNGVISTISTDGVLTVKAPPPPKALKANERIVQIQETGPAHMSVKTNQEEETTKAASSKPKKTDVVKQQS